jgi:hypothetical protein
MKIWHFILQITGVDNPSGKWYAFWSGFASDIPLVGGLILLFRKHVCHQPGCYRIGRHAIEGTPYIVCKKHHPQIGDI